MQCFEYNHETGEIICFYNVPEEVYEHMKQEGKYLLKGMADPELQYVNVKANPPALLERPKQSTIQDKTEITADGSDLMTLSSLPVPCSILIDNGVSQVDYDVDDGIFEWGTLERGNYAVIIMAFPYLDWYGAVRAV